MEILFVIVIVVCVCSGTYKLFTLFFRPDIYLEEKRQKHEREMATRARNRQAMGLAGSLFRMFFGG